GLQTVVGFTRRLDRSVGKLRREVLLGGTVLSIDLNKFKGVNDGWGHAAGNQVLAEVGNRLRAQARRADDIAGRLGGDEFALFLAGLHDSDMATRRATEVLESLCQPIATSKGTAWIGASIGILVIEAWGGVPSSDTLLHHADDAMFHAKQAGGGVHLYDPDEPASVMGERSKAQG